MRKGLWILAAIGFGGVLATVILGGLVGTSVVGPASGVEEARGLQETLRAAHAVHVEPEPPLRVLRVPPSEEWPGWRWKIEARLRSAANPASPAVARALDRMAARALRTRVLGRAPSGVMMDLRLADGATRRVLFDGTGRRVEGPRPPGPASAPPPGDPR